MLQALLETSSGTCKDMDEFNRHEQSQAKHQKCKSLVTLKLGKKRWRMLALVAWNEFWTLDIGNPSFVWVTALLFNDPSYSSTRF